MHRASFNIWPISFRFLPVIIKNYWYSETVLPRFAQSRFAQSHFAQSRFAQSHFAQSRFAQYRFAQYRFALSPWVTGKFIRGVFVPEKLTSNIRPRKIRTSAFLQLSSIDR